MQKRFAWAVVQEMILVLVVGRSLITWFGDGVEGVTQRPKRRVEFSHTERS